MVVEGEDEESNEGSFESDLDNSKPPAIPEGASANVASKQKPKRKNPNYAQRNSSKSKMAKVPRPYLEYHPKNFFITEIQSLHYAALEKWFRHFQPVGPVLQKRNDRIGYLEKLQADFMRHGSQPPFEKPITREIVSSLTEDQIGDWSAIFASTSASIDHVFEAVQKWDSIPVPSIIEDYVAMRPATKVRHHLQFHCLILIAI